MRKSFLLFGSILLCTIELSAQSLSYEYDYDLSGNRIRRSVIRLSKEDTKFNEDTLTLPLLDDLSDGNQMKVFPNPTKGLIRFEIGQVDCPLGYYYLFDFKGTLVEEGICESKVFNLDLSGQPSGVYLIEIRYKNKVYISKIIKE